MVTGRNLSIPTARMVYVGGRRENGVVDVGAREILRLRLATQRIDPPGDAGVTAAVRHMLAIQAQDFANALWAVGLRTKDSGRTDVLAALSSGEVVRTLPMRGTLHFVASEDLRWILALTAERTLRSAASRFRNLGLDRSTLERAELLVRDALSGSGSLTREQFMKLLAENGIAPDGQRGYHVIFYLCQRAVVCWGPPAGTQQALVLVDEWITAAPERDRQDALASFALRYFASHGPATERDFAWWTKLTLRDVRSAVASLGDQVTTLTHDGVDYLIATTALDALPAAPAAPAAPSSPSRQPSHVRSMSTAVLALPGFDEYLLGYQDRALALSDEHFQRIVPGNNGIFLPMIVSRGEVVGTWRRAPRSRAAEVTDPAIVPEHFVEATRATLTSFDRAARRYARFAAS